MYKVANPLLHLILVLVHPEEDPSRILKAKNKQSLITQTENISWQVALLSLCPAPHSDKILISPLHLFITACLSFST